MKTIALISVTLLLGFTVSAQNKPVRPDIPHVHNAINGRPVIYAPVFPHAHAIIRVAPVMKPEGSHSHFFIQKMKPE